MVDTMTVSFGCPSSGCANQHAAVVAADSHDRAETLCKDCSNRVVARTRDGRVVETEAL